MNESDNKFQQIHTMLKELRRFDPRFENVNVWFSRYELYCNQYQWAEEECRDNLIYFLDSGLIKVFLETVERVQENSDNLAYASVRQRIISQVDSFIIPKDSDTFKHLESVFKDFDRFKFTYEERRYWLDHFIPFRKYKELCKFDSKLDEYRPLNFLMLIYDE